MSDIEVIINFLMVVPFVILIAIIINYLEGGDDE